MKQEWEMNEDSAQSVGLRIVLCTLNSKYSHTSLALRLLREACRPYLSVDDELIIAEYTINDQPNLLLQRIYEFQADVYAFSCYIWNSQLTRQLIRDLGSLRPEARLILGGPEAAWQQQELMNELPELDVILAGEGELNLPPLLAGLAAGSSHDEVCKEISGISWRDSSGQVFTNPVNKLDLTADWPFAYSNHELEDLNDRILYYESSRGCPFGCTYCMSSRDRKVRFRNLETVFAELDRFIAADVKLVKFVDRTFNCDADRAVSIWQYLIDRHEKTGYRTRFHFEIAADLLDDAAIEILSNIPEGLFQFEIGVQSCNAEVLKLINRSCDLEKLFDRCRKLRLSGNIHMHLDLIAGLPGDDLRQMTDSFNQIMSLSPHMLQLGFLKVLPGSIMRDQASQHGLLWRSYPPYEILHSDGMSFNDILRLKRIETQLDRYYNNGSFVLSISYLLTISVSAFALFEAMALVNKQLGWEELAPGRHGIWELPLKLLESKICDSCFDSISPDPRILRDCLLIDYLSSGQKDQPSWQMPFDQSQQVLDRADALLIRERNRQEFPRLRRIRVESFCIDPSSLFELRKQLIRNGLSNQLSGLAAKSACTSTINEFEYGRIDKIHRCGQDQEGWLAVFDMSESKPELVWQISRNCDIRDGVISRVK